MLQVAVGYSTKLVCLSRNLEKGDGDALWGKHYSCAISQLTFRVSNTYASPFTINGFRVSFGKSKFGFLIWWILFEKGFIGFEIRRIRIQINALVIYACLVPGCLYPSHGPLRFITSHSRFALASAMRKTKRLRRRLDLRCSIHSGYEISQMIQLYFQLKYSRRVS